MTEEEKLNELRGAPITVTLCGKTVEVKKLRMKQQLAVIDRLTTIGEGPKPSDVVALMRYVVSVATGMSEETLDEESGLEEIPDAFAALWKQNDFRFLLQKAGIIRGLLAGESSPSQA